MVDCFCTYEQTSSAYYILSLWESRSDSQLRRNRLILTAIRHLRSSSLLIAILKGGRLFFYGQNLQLSILMCVLHRSHLSCSIFRKCKESEIPLLLICVLFCSVFLLLDIRAVKYCLSVIFGITAVKLERRAEEWVAVFPFMCFSRSMSVVFRAAAKWIIHRWAVIGCLRTAKLVGAHGSANFCARLVPLNHRWTPHR